MITIEQLLTGTAGVALYIKNKNFESIGTDTRTDLTNKIFFALKGDQFDGHRFIDKAVAAGAAAIVSHESRPENANDITWVQVPDTLIALQMLAKYWRGLWGGKLIGITGSNGKTTVKDFTFTLITGTFSAIKNEGSFNNHWGLPITLMRLRSEHQWGVVEMGMNHSGEISQLVKTAHPDVVVVTMVGTAHIEFFGTIEKIAEAKAEIYRDADKGGVGVFNLQNPHTQKMYDHWANTFSKSISFADPRADVYLQIEKKNSRGLTVKGSIGGVVDCAETQIWGEQNVYNLMAAAALALAAGVTPKQIWQRLPLCEMGWGRNQWVELKTGATVLFDGYNANPESFSALFSNIVDSKNTFTKVYGIFAEMRELGDQSEDAHYQLGHQAANSAVDEVIFFGASQNAFKRGFESAKCKKNLIISDTYKEELAIKIKNMLDSKSLVVVKGSRGAQLERAVLALDPLNFKKK